MTTIRAAITAAGTYGRVYFPGKGSVYIYDGRLTPLFAQEWFGDSIATTKLLGGAENDYGIFIEGSAAEMRGFYLHDLTLDTGNLRRDSGLELYTASACTIARVRFANVTTGGWHAKIGVKTSATDEYLCEGIQLVDCEFDGHEGSLESLLLFNTRNCRVVRPTFRNKTVQGPVLGLWQKTYNTVIEDTVFIDCIGSGIYYSFTCEETHIIRPYFKKVGTAIGGSNQSDNGAFGEVQAKGLYITSPVCVGGANSANAGARSIGAVDRVEVTNPQITGYAVPIRISQGQSAGLPYPSSHVRIAGGDIYDNNPTNNVHILHPGILISGVGGSLQLQIEDVQIYDTRATKYQRYPIVFSGAFTWSDIEITGCRLEADTANSAMPIGFEGGATIDATVRIHDNVGLNPDNWVYDQGDVTGATTFSRTNGDTILTRLTGNVTATLPPGQRGDILVLRLTQDATGSRTITWPSNLRKAGGLLVLSTAAGAVDVVALRWDGTNWIEVSRSMGVS